MLKISYKIILLSFIFLLFTPLYADSQVVPKLENIIVLEVSPTYPGPEERVTISAESFSIDLSSSRISWFINDILQQQSVGETFFQFTTGKLGSKAKIDIVAETIDGSLETERVTIRPVDIDILWQADTFTPPLYKGKGFASVGGSINVEAVPHFTNDAGRKLNPDALIYSWRVENKALPNASGIGKNTINITQIKPVGSIAVEVRVESVDKILSGKHSALIPVTDSEIVVYENSPLLGILFNKSIRDLYSLMLQETKLIAYPFFMSATDRNSSNLNYSWKLNDNPITLGEDRSSITVSHTGGEVGEAEISVSVQNSREIFQRNDREFTIEFGKNTSSGFSF